MIPLIDDEEFPDGHGSGAFLFRLGEQLFQPVQADGLLPDLRHEPQAARRRCAHSLSRYENVR